MIDRIITRNTLQLLYTFSGLLQALCNLVLSGLLMKFENVLYETPDIFINRCYYVLKYFGEPLYT